MEFGYQMEQIDRTRVLPRPNTPKHRFCADRTNRNTGTNQTKQTGIRVLTRPKYNLYPDQTDQNIGLNQIEQIQ